jgi:predicted cupin superfamily sugar epimerase
VGWSLLGATMSPGFDFQDFELGSRKKFRKFFPSQETLVDRLTKRGT